MKRQALILFSICVFALVPVGCGSSAMKENTAADERTGELSTEEPEESTATDIRTEELSTEEPKENTAEEEGTEEMRTQEPEESTAADERTEELSTEEPEESTAADESTGKSGAEDTEENPVAEETTGTLSEPEIGESDQGEVQSDIRTNNMRLVRVFEELKEEFPDGYYWNRGGVTQIPCDHQNLGKDSCNIYDGAVSEYLIGGPGRQCFGFASLLSDRLFGRAAPVRGFTDFDELQPGDIVRISHEDITFHASVVVSKNGDELEIVHCNPDFSSCRIEWGAKLTRTEIEQDEYIYLSRRMATEQADE